MITFFFFNDTATTEIYTLSLHDALPISLDQGPAGEVLHVEGLFVSVSVGHFEILILFAERVHGLHGQPDEPLDGLTDRKSTRLNSSHSQISYAVFCLKKKKNQHLNEVPN